MTTTRQPLALRAHPGDPTPRAARSSHWPQATRRSLLEPTCFAASALALARTSARHGPTPRALSATQPAGRHSTPRKDPRARAPLGSRLSHSQARTSSHRGARNPEADLPLIEPPGPERHDELGNLDPHIPAHNGSARVPCSKSRMSGARRSEPGGSGGECQRFAEFTTRHAAPGHAVVSIRSQTHSGAEAHL